MNICNTGNGPTEHGHSAEDGYHPQGTDAIPVFDPRVAFDVRNVEFARLVYKHEITEKDGGFYYARRAQPTVELLLKYLKSIQQAEGAVATSSGMSAADLVLHTFFGLAGAEEGPSNGVSKPIIIFGTGIYYEVDRLIQKRAGQLGYEFYRIPTYNPDAFRRELSQIPAERVRLVWIETPENPLLGMTSIIPLNSVLRELAPNALLLVDNSALPLFQRSLKYGADLELISLTKYVNGMGDAMGGAILARTPKLEELLRNELDSSGAVLSSEVAYRMLRSLSTLHLRMEHHCQTAQFLAHKLAGHKSVQNVYYPTLPGSCRGYLAATIKDQMSGRGGGLVAIKLTGGYAAGDRLMQLILRQRAARESTLYIISTFGMPSTHVEHYMSFMRLREGIKREDTSEGDICPGMCRIAVGLASGQEIWKDLEELLNQVPN